MRGIGPAQEAELRSVAGRGGGECIDGIPARQFGKPGNGHNRILSSCLGNSSRAPLSDPPSTSTPFSHHVTARRQLKHVIGANWEVYLLSFSCRRREKRERGTQLEMERLCGTWPANVDRGEHRRVWSGRRAGGWHNFYSFELAVHPSTVRECVRSRGRLRDHYVHRIVKIT